MILLHKDVGDTRAVEIYKAIGFHEETAVIWMNDRVDQDDFRDGLRDKFHVLSLGDS